MKSRLFQTAIPPVIALLFLASTGMANAAASGSASATAAPGSTGSAAPAQGNSNSTATCTVHPATYVTPASTNAPAQTKTNPSSVSLSPTSLSFASQTLNVPSPAQPVTLSNNGTAALTVKITASGDFAQTNTCASPVAAAGTCTISVIFTPTAAGSRTGTLTITPSDKSSPQTVKFSGTGTGSAVAGAPAKQAAPAAPAAPAKTPKAAAGSSTAKSAVYNMRVPAGTTNAAEIVTLLTGSIPGVTSVNFTLPDVLTFTLDPAKVVLAPAKPAKGQISTDDLVKMVKDDAIKGHVFTVNLPAGKIKACDVANAMVNAIPGILEISAVGDSQLLITSADSSDAETAAATAFGKTYESTPSQREQFEELVRAKASDVAAPATPPAPYVNSYVQRLYYVHDPATVATIVKTAMPNINAQALLPDIVVLSDSADTDAKTQKNAIDQSRKLIARIDQPRPQVSVDAWSMQLASDNPEGIRDASEQIRKVAAGYDHTIDSSFQAGWQYLSSQLAKPGNLDPLLRDYLSYSTRITLVDGKPAINRTADPSKASAQQTAGYGLGYSTLYYPLTPNLVDMLVTLISLNDPKPAANELLNRMEGPKGESAHTKYVDDIKEFNKVKDDSNNTKANPQKSCQQRDREIYESYRLDAKAKGVQSNPADHQPDNFQLECVRDTLDNGLFAKSATPLSTGAIGQFRAALADFLYQYKLMVKYPDEFDSYYEPMAADTLDSAFSPLVNAFEEDMSALQHDLQAQIGEILPEKGKVKGYGYSGLVNVKVLGSQQGAVTSLTQNYFDATPTASLNTLISNLGTQAGSGGSLTSLFTGITPDKALAILSAIGTTLNPPKVTAHIGRELDLTVTAHTLSGAFGAELDVQVNSAENGQSVYTQGATTTTDNLDSRVATHTVNTHVRLDSLRLLQLSTMSSVLARSQQPWKPFDPVVEFPGLGLLFKHPRKAKEVYTQSLIFVDAMVVPTAIDLGYGVPIATDQFPPKKNANSQQATLSGGNNQPDEKLRSELNEVLRNQLPNYHQSIIGCLYREYIDGNGKISIAYGSDGTGLETTCSFQKSTPFVDVAQPPQLLPSDPLIPIKAPASAPQPGDSPAPSTPPEH
jgi:hypothetical protein